MRPGDIGIHWVSLRCSEHVLEPVIQDKAEDVNGWVVDFIRWICCSRSNDCPCMLLKLVVY